MIKIPPISKLLLTSSQSLPIIIFHYSSKSFFKNRNHNKPFPNPKPYHNQPTASSTNAQSSTKIQLADFDQQKWRVQLSHSKEIKDFDKISYCLQFLRTPQLAQFLKKLYPYLNLKNIQQNAQLFQRIQTRLKSFSQSLKIQTQQLIQILKFHVKVRSLNNDLDFYHNYGFEKYASITTSNLIFNKKLNLNQTIFVFSSIVPLGDSHLNLFINFLKYFKNVANQQPLSLKLEHYLTLLNTKFSKRNDIILENTAYDRVLCQLLNNLQQILKGASITFKTQTLCTLLKYDNRISYITDSQKHITQTIKLMTQLRNIIKQDWFSKTWLIEQQNQQNISMINVVHIIDCMLFVKNNMINYQNYQQQINIFCEKAYNTMKTYFIGLLTNPINTIISQKNMHLLIRFALNPLIVPLWIKDNTIFMILFSILANFNIKNPETFLPLAKAIDQFSHQKQILQPLLLFTLTIAKQNLTKNIILKDLIVLCLKYSLEVNKFSQYFLKLNKEQIEKNLTFILFIEKLTSSKKLFYTQQQIKINHEKATNFMNELYTITLSSKSIEGFTNSLQILSEHSQTINGLINPMQHIDNKKSQRNHYLSRESLQFCSLIFFNIINGIPIPENLKKIYDKLILNNILLYHILKRFFRENYPLPNMVERPQFFGDFTTVLKNVLNYFESMDRYSYFVWDSMIKLYSTQPYSIRQQSFPLIQKCFLSTIQKQKARKVILTMTMMKLIASGVIIGPRPKLQQLFELTVDDLLSAEENKAFYSKCYTEIIFSAIAADVLTPIYFDKIIAHCLKRDENMKHTSVIMLIYGASLKGRNLVGGVVDPTIISKQSAYLQRLITQKVIRPSNQKSTSFFTITLNNEVICYLFSFGTLSIMKMDKIIFEYIQNCKDFSKWRTMVNCYTPQNYSMFIKEQVNFRRKINNLFIDKLIYFKRLRMISQKEETYFIDKFK